MATNRNRKPFDLKRNGDKWRLGKVGIPRISPIGQMKRHTD